LIRVSALTDDPLLAAFADIRERDLRRRSGLFIAEGEVVLRVLFDSRFTTRAVLLSEQAAPKIEVPAGIPTYVAPLPLMQELVGFPIHRGVLALGERSDARVSADLIVGLAGITNHDNVGGIFRNAAAFGVGGVLLDRASCDPLYRKAIRVSVGGTLKVPFDFVDDEDALVDALSDYELLALSPRGELVVGRDEPPRGKKRALLLGAEGPGLSERTLRRCRTARIDMAKGWDSLNVAVTSGIALHWLCSA
jgi:tRNA G18 (ribose-2'-O)-methylase SpoU